MTKTFQCSYCGATAYSDRRMPDGHTHHARRDCGGCGRFIRWLPKPPPNPEPPSDLLHRVPIRIAPVPWTRATQKQTAFADTIRTDLIDRFTREGRSEIANLLKSIKDPTWFIANREGPIRWPEPSQIEFVNRS